MAKKWRCAVVGTGVIGEWHARVIPKIPNAELVGMCDIKVPERGRQIIEKYNLGDIPIFTDQAEMMKKQNANVIHICTPSGNHLEPALMAMEAGVNVICEKPMEITLERMDRMIETARRNDVRLAGIFQTRWHKANRAIKQAAEEGRFGTLAWGGAFTPWYRTDEYYAAGGWRGTWKLDGGGAMMNQSIHTVDLLQWIMGPVRRVSAYAGSRIHSQIEVEDTLTCALQFANGAYGSIMGTTAMYPGSSVRIEIGGADGTAVQEGGLKRFKFREERPEDAALLEELSTRKSKSTGGGASATDISLDQHGENIQHILEAWDAGREPMTNAAEARKAVALILAMYESARRNGEPVDLG